MVQGAKISPTNDFPQVVSLYKFLLMKKKLTLAILLLSCVSGIVYALTAAGSVRQTGMNSYFGADTLRQDPVCNMKVDDKKGDTIHYKGHIFGFCSKGCRASFMKAPDSFLPKKN